MDHDDDNTEHDDGNGHDHSAPMADPVLIALELCRIAASPKTIAVALKKLRRLDAQYADTQAKVAALTAQAAAIDTALTTRVAELDRRQVEIERRETEFEVSVREAHAALRASHDNLGEVDRRLRYRIASSADMLHGFNEQLQDLPSWQQIKQMVPGLSDDLPAPTAEVVSQNVREDWSGNIFSPSTLTRTVRGAA
jgi:hypothetical protein